MLNWLGKMRWSQDDRLTDSKNQPQKIVRRLGGQDAIRVEVRSTCAEVEVEASLIEQGIVDGVAPPPPTTEGFAGSLEEEQLA